MNYRAQRLRCSFLKVYHKDYEKTVLNEWNQVTLMDVNAFFMITYLEPAEKDLPELLEMMQEFYAIDAYPFDREQKQELMRELLDKPDLGRLWKIEVDGVPAGYLALVFSFSFEHGGMLGVIDELFLRKSFRNRGLGKKILLFVENKAWELGIKSLLLEVENHNETGNRLYSHLGYTGKARSLLTKKLF